MPDYLTAPLCHCLPPPQHKLRLLLRLPAAASVITPPGWLRSCILLVCWITFRRQLAARIVGASWVVILYAATSRFTGSPLSTSFTYTSTAYLRIVLPRHFARGARRSYPDNAHTSACRVLDSHCCTRAFRRSCLCRRAIYRLHTCCSAVARCLRGSAYSAHLTRRGNARHAVLRACRLLTACTLFARCGLL